MSTQRVTGTCGLCRELRELCDSHLIPAAAYKLSRSEDRRNQHPVVVRRTGIMTSAEQVRAHFLCRECEDRFSRCGERHVLGQCARPGGGFKLRQLLQSKQPTQVGERFAIYSLASLPELRCEQYLYFAASVFWRAAARSWRYGDETAHIDLGTRDLEHFRLYLLDEAPFPESAYLRVHAWNDSDIDFTTVFPYSRRDTSHWTYKFCIPGIGFILFLGEGVPREGRIGSLNCAEAPFVWLSPWESDGLAKGFSRLIASAPVKSRDLE